MTRWNKAHNRFESSLPPERVKTYSMTAPLSSHWRRATCQEYECEGIVNGFVITVDTGTELGQKQFYYLTHDTDRKYSMQRVDQTLFKFLYGPGNPCFRRGDHRVPIGRPPFYLVAEGDWRGNPRGTPAFRHRRVEDWVDEFANHQNSIAAAIKRG